MMKEQMDTLVKLQAILSEAAEIRTELTSVPEKIRSVDRQRETSANSIAEQSALVDELTKKYRSFETDAKQNQSQISKSQVKLQSVKTNKEYQSSLKEIEELKKNNSLLEDEMLECLDQIDAAEKGLVEKRSDFDRLAVQLDDQRTRIERDAAEKKERLALLDSEEADVMSSVDSNLMSVFNTVKEKQPRGVAIAAVKDAVCQGCNVNIPPQRYNELQRGDQLMFCPNCQRIIYWKQD